MDRLEKSPAGQTSKSTTTNRPTLPETFKMSSGLPTLFPPVTVVPEAVPELLLLRLHHRIKVKLVKRSRRKYNVFCRYLCFITIFLRHVCM